MAFSAVTILEYCATPAVTSAALPTTNGNTVVRGLDMNI